VIPINPGCTATKTSISFALHFAVCVDVRSFFRRPAQGRAACRPTSTRVAQCSVDSECASGHCLKEINLCKGVDPGQPCTPGYPLALWDILGRVLLLQACSGTSGPVGRFDRPHLPACVLSVARPARRSRPPASAAITACCLISTPLQAYAPRHSPSQQASLQTSGPFMCAAANAVIVQLGCHGSRLALPLH